MKINDIRYFDWMTVTEKLCKKLKPKIEKKFASTFNAAFV
jgi:hypothetical protein